MKLERDGWSVRQFFPGSLSRGKFGAVTKTDPTAAIVRLLHSPRRSPSTPISQRLVSALNETGPVAFEHLVKRVATELYEEELRKGAGVLDIGLFGSRLFNGDVIQELQAGDGVFWEIKEEREST